MNSENIKYRYALDGSSRVVDIFSDQAVKGTDYICLSCNKTLRPVKGSERQHHFRHKVQANCSSETYLHNLAKRIFAQTYQECLDNGRPYIINYLVPVRCIACSSNGPCNVGQQLQSVDLTKHFKVIDIEARNEGFIPDILLTSGVNSLYVEIAVTHFLEDKKVNSGVRIVEIHVDSENDIELITSCCLSEENPRIKIANFRKVPIDLHCADQCVKSIYCFIVYPSGKSILRSISIPEFEGLVDKGIHVEKVDRFGRGTPEEEFTNRLGRAFQKGLPVRNCWLCSFHCLRYQTFQSFCRLKKSVVENSNQAVDCDRYNQIEKVPDCGLIRDAQNRVLESKVRQVKKRQQSQQELKRVIPRDIQDLGQEFFERLGETSTDVKSNRQDQQILVSQYPLNSTTELERPKSGKKATCVFCGAEYEEESVDWWWFSAVKGECKCKLCLQKGLS